MAHLKNTARSKRKYGAERQSITARNKARKAVRHERRTARLMERTANLLGVKVHFGSKKSPKVGNVTAIIKQGDENYSKEPKANGQYLAISFPGGSALVRRRAVRL